MTRLPAFPGRWLEKKKQHYQYVNKRNILFLNKVSYTLDRFILCIMDYISYRMFNSTLASKPLDKYSVQLE